MKKTILCLIILLFSTQAFGFYLYWPPTGASSYKVYRVTQWDPLNFELLAEVTDSRFNLEGRINIADFTYFAVTSCCGTNCSLIYRLIAILDIDPVDIPWLKAAHYQLEIELNTPIFPE